MEMRPKESFKINAPFNNTYREIVTMPIQRKGYFDKVFLSHM